MFSPELGINSLILQSDQYTELAVTLVGSEKSSATNRRIEPDGKILLLFFPHAQSFVLQREVSAYR